MEVKGIKQTLFFCSLFPSLQQVGVKAQVEPSLYVVKEVTPTGVSRIKGYFIACAGGGWPWESRTRQTFLHDRFLVASLDSLQRQGVSGFLFVKEVGLGRVHLYNWQD